MRYSEAIRKLEEEPTLEFKLVETYKTWTLKTDYDPRYLKDGILYFSLECEGEDSMGGAGEFSGNLLINDDRWEVVRHPVTWQEAIQAWADGKTVSVKLTTAGGEFERTKTPAEYIANDEITTGIWYVED